MRGFGSIVLGLAALLLPQAASAQRLVVLTYQVGTGADSVTFVDLDRVERSGDFATATAFDNHTETFLNAKQARVWQRLVRVRIDCRTNQVRQVLVQKTSQIVSPEEFAAAQTGTIPADSPAAIGMCGRAGTLTPPWPLLNSEFAEAPETRTTMYPRVTGYPWDWLSSAFESFVRMRAILVYQQLAPAKKLFASSKPVAGVPAQGFAYTPLTWAYTDLGTGPATFSGGYVELRTVTQQGADYYFYSVSTVARTNYKVEGLDSPHYDLGVEVRCGAQPAQRIFAMEFFHPRGAVESRPLPMAEMQWHAAMFPFSTDLCAHRFDKTARQMATGKEAVADLLEAYLKH